MANDLDRRGQRDLVPYTVTLSEEGREITISPFTAVFLKTVWGTDRLTRLTESHIGLAEAIRRLRAAQIRSDNIEQEMAEILAIETIERADRYTTFEHKIARTSTEIDILASEKERRIQENEREIARLKAEAREYDRKVQPASRQKDGERKSGDAVDRGVEDAQNHFRIIRELNNLCRAVDESVATGEFTKEQGEVIKGELEQKVFASVAKP